MNKTVSVLLYNVFALCIIVLDRITKLWALKYAAQGITINQFVSFDLVFNRGVTAGLLQSYDAFWFTVLSIVIATIIAGLGAYTVHRWNYGYSVIGEVATLAGALSNVYDRFVHAGVIDFIHCSWGSYSFPIFNIADVCIVAGVGYMFIMHMRDDA